MKFKTLFLAGSLLATAAVFSFCTKETPVTEPVTEATDSNEEANSRGVCKVLVEAINTNATVCGTQSNAVVCSGLVGSDLIPNGNAQLYIITTPATMIFTGPNAAGRVRVTTANGAVLSPQFGLLPNGEWVVNIDNNCNQ